ncbi:MAG: cell division protein FtsL [Eubacteriales bacterium]|nr:cell division protein FtsL [Eubacteriales bacterium]
MVNKSNVRNVRNARTTASSYEYGSAVRQLNTAEPLKRPDRRKEIDEQERAERRRRARQIKRNSRVNFLYTIMLIGVATCAFFVCYQYLNLQSNVKTNSDKVIELQNNLNSLREDNDVYESSIKTSINYDEIYNTAVEELGMVYPDRGQVINYDSNESEYVRQYKDIPAAN